MPFYPTIMESSYNIYSSLDAMHHDGYFYIGTEVGNEFVERALKEIYHEFEVLQNDLIDLDELSMVKNYLLGNLLTMVDGAFNISEVVKTQIMEELAPDYLEKLVHSIRTIEAKDVQQLAQKYLQREDMWEVIVG